MLLQPATVSFQINTAFTNQRNDNENNVIFQYHCLYADASIGRKNSYHHIIAYCASESLSKSNIQANSDDQRFTFADLRRQNITSQQLYLWSAPIDIAESYEFYLSQVSTSNDISMETQHFYNCTLPRFGPLCQYTFDEYELYFTSLNEIIHHAYLFEYQPTTYTCYILLQCNRGPAPLCLDWTEICNGKIDCVDGGQDEEHCWQLEINECQENEYRCISGQCIPEEFFRDDANSPDCLDGSDEVDQRNYTYEYCVTAEPTFGCEDVACSSLLFNDLNPLSSSCLKRRSELIMEQVLMKPNSMSESCWSLFKCILHVSIFIEDQDCFWFCTKHNCSELLMQACEEILYVPAEPSLLGGFYFKYVTQKMSYLPYGPMDPHYVCVNDKLCDKIFAVSESPSDKNITCHPFDPFYIQPDGHFISMLVKGFIQLYRTCHSIVNNSSVLCEKSNMYQCMNMSKCISRYRINDRNVDCLYADDEFFYLAPEAKLASQFGKCFHCLQKNVCIPYRLVKDGFCNCGDFPQQFCEDENPELLDARINISFQTVCDGFVDLLPATISERNETDETECERWPCNNSYTRCNGHWNCLNGADEVDCDPTPLLNCPMKHHICISLETNLLTCLPLNKADDGKIDCIGATDEPRLCRYTKYSDLFAPFYCETEFGINCIPIINLCNFYQNCLNNEDERFCGTNQDESIVDSISYGENASIRSDTQKFFGEYVYKMEKSPIVHFSLGQTQNLADPIIQIDDRTMIQHSFKTRRHEQRCHRGLHLRVWLDREKNLTTITCFCPPSFYGDSCQYQNQRVSLTMQFRSLSDSWRTPFALVVSLIDDSEERMIHSLEQFMYLPMRDCQRKFNVYLLYSTRPKNHSKNYSIHIDIYEKISLAYRGSFLLPILFPFLPVNRLAVQLNIPQSRETFDSCTDHPCVHGQCTNYVNTPTRAAFCRCYQGWSGHFCTIPHPCTCSQNSLCIGVSTSNQSICVCPIDRFGFRCFLTKSVCQFNGNVTCDNGGQCIPQEEYVQFNKRYTCICPNGFTGERCEKRNTEISISFHKDIDLSETIHIHFIQVIKDASPERSTTFKTISVDQDSVIVYWSRPFHLVFVELLNKNYYLALIQRAYTQSATIKNTIYPSDRCKHISEVFSETVVNLDLTRRIKYYHLPCQQYRSVNLSCFYDDVHLCLCEDYGHQSLANCLKFEHEMKFDCSGQSSCENGGRCFQDSPNCAQTSMCVCPTCFYGKRCQFSTSGFSLSLDTILGYHIRPHVNLIDQSMTLKLTIGLAVVLIVAGLISGSFSLITFHSKKLHEVGCGIYLLGSSITTLLTMTIFSLKFGIVISLHMGLVVSRFFLHFQCKSIDFLLQTSLHMDQWLNACVAVERATATLRGVKFNKKMSKKAAKLMIVGLLILTISTAVHDPIYRHLLDDIDGDEQRIWCIVSYPASIQIFNRVVQGIHFFVPFAFNLISALIIIIVTARRRATAKKHQSYTEHLRHQFQQHKNLFIAPVVFVILIVPRLVISFASGCMKSSYESKLYLAGYFISFIPPVLTFVVFVIPSKLYKGEFIATARRQQNLIQAYVNRIL